MRQLDDFTKSQKVITIISNEISFFSSKFLVSKYLQLSDQDLKLNDKWKQEEFDKLNNGLEMGESLNNQIANIIESKKSKKKSKKVDKVKDNVYALNNYFIGAVAGSNWTNCFDNSYVKIVQENNQQFILTNKVKTTDFTIRRIKFFKCKLTSDDFKNIKTSDYFEHYSEFRWGNNKVPIIKFDKIFDRKKYID